MELRRLLSTRRLSLAVTSLAALLSLSSGGVLGQTPPAKKPAPTPAPVKPAATVAKPGAAAAKPGGAASGAARTGTSGATTTAGKTTTTTAGHPTTTTTAAHPTTTTAGAARPTATTAAGARPNATSPAGVRGGPAAGHEGPGARPGVAGVKNGPLAHGGPVNSHDRVGHDGNAMRVRADGRPSDIHDARRGMDIHNNLRGGRRVEMERRDGSHLYYERGRPGYIGHEYRYGGRVYDHRSYYYNGRVYDRFYNRYEYRPGVYLDVYAPARYYGPGFYGWAYNPWAAPIAYQWGFANAAWYGYYPGYFTPYPVYASSSLWLTDYLIAQSLQASYAAAQAANAQAQMAGMAPLADDTKQMIADEVARQLSAEYHAAQDPAVQSDPAKGSIGPMIADGQPHVFLAGKEVDVVDVGGQECAITDGDVVKLIPQSIDSNGIATVQVMSSKGGVECRPLATVTISLADLQDMQNHLRETMDQGLSELQAKQGTAGLPRAPVSALAAPAPTEMAKNAPPPDDSVKTELTAQDKEADVAAKEVEADTAGSGGPSDSAASAPATAPAAAPAADVDLTGMTIAQVVALKGQPISPPVVSGAKTIYIYKDFKVIFKNGKEVDIE